MTALRTSNAPIGLSRGKPISTYNNPPAWVRPSDWVTFTPPAASEQKVIGTVAVWNQDSNYMAVNVTITDGTQYTVDWGDGTTSDHNSGTTAEKNYVWSDISSGTLTSEGYRQAIVTITPKTAGKTFSQLQLCRLHSAYSGTNLSPSSPWLDIAIAAPNSTTLEFSNSAGGTSTNRIRPIILENVNIVSINTQNISNMFRSMYSLQNVTIGSLPAGNISAATAFFDCFSLKIAPVITGTFGTITGMFQNCSALVSVPLYDITGTTSLQNMFSGCTSLTTIPPFNTSGITNFSSMFATCRSLVKLPPNLNLSSAQSCSSMFSGCSSLESIPPFTTSVFLSNTQSMFAGCSSLKSVPLFTTSGVTNASTMFQGCFSLESVPSYNFTAVTSATAMFQNCYSLKSVPDLNFNSLTSANTMFISNNITALREISSINLNLITSASSNNLRLGESIVGESKTSLGRANIINNKFTQSFQNCSLGATQLDEIYTGLSTLNPSITNITGTGSVVTVTVGTSFIRPFTTGRSVTITGVDPVAYNITGTVASVNNTAGTFTINNAATGTYVSGGTATITSDVTITVTGNPGVTGDDPTIATNKGWTVTG